jgi:hypothetical protein
MEYFSITVQVDWLIPQEENFASARASNSRYPIALVELMSLQVSFSVHDPQIWGPIFAETTMDVEDNTIVADIKKKILPKLTARASSPFFLFVGDWRI